MQKITIDNWYGRLGNNIQQISNAIFYCKENKLNFYGSTHPQILKFNLNFGYDKNISNRFFFYNTKFKDFDCDVNKLNSERRSICLKYIKPNLNFFIKEAYDDDIVVIHIRSGDIFSNNPHTSYVPNPLCFYEEIINQYDIAIVVAEDYNNPIIFELQKNPKVLIQSTNIENDFATLLRAKNLVSSGVGTFAVAAALCSTNIKNFFCSNIFLDEHLNPTMLRSDINVIIKEIPNYIKIGEWKNTEKQRRQILKYKF
jgi:hypothetical protein